MADTDAPAAAEARPELQYHDDRVFVGSFKEGTDMEAVEALLKPIGNIANFKNKTKVRKLEESRETVENAFVRFETADEAAACITKLNGTDMLGSTIRVEYQIKRPRKKKERKPAAAKPAKEAAPAEAVPAKPADPCRIIVKALANGTTEEQLRAAASGCGDIVSLELITRNRWRAFLTFGTAEAATAAIASLNGVEVNGATVKAESESPRAPRPARATKAKAAPAAPKPQDPTATFVGNLDVSVTKEMLQEKVAGVTKVRFLKRRAGPDGAEATFSNAILTFASQADADAVVAKNETEIFAGSGTVRAEAAKPRGAPRE